MAGSEKGLSFLEPLRDLNKLELHSHTKELKKIDQTNESLLSKHAIPHKLPLKLPQRRKFFTLSMHNSADSEVDLRHNSPASDAEIERRRTPAQKEGGKAMDLGAMEGTSKLEMAMESNLGGEEKVMEKKKLLVQLTGMNPGTGKIKALHESSGRGCYESFKGFHKSFEGFHESSIAAASPINASRICRFCSREFPSGRALGGHMRVHGAFLDAHTSVSIKQEKQKDEEKLGSKGKDAHAAAADLTATEPIEEREKASLFCSEGRKKASMMLSSESLHSVEIARQHQDGERDHHVRDLNYYDCSSGYCFESKTNNRQLLASDGIDGIKNVSLSSELKKHHGALYELRRNPKPNQRFIKELHVAQITDSINPNCHGNHSVAPLLADDHTRSSPSQSPERARPCSECGKVFFSWKALFGHMRCHPEREWRGIQRPDNSMELDRTARMITRRPSAEGSMDGAYNKSSCMKVENTEEIAEVTTMDSKEEEKNIVSFGIHGNSGMAFCLDAKEAGVEIDTGCNKGRKDDEGKENKGECINSKHEAVIHAHIDEMTDDWTPIWSSAGKRSKRRRVANMHMHRHPPALTSETTSNEIKLDQKGPGIKDQEELDMANCLVLLSSAGQSMQEVNKMCVESTEESAFSHPGKVRRVFSNADQWEGASDAGDDAVEDCVHVRDDYEAEDRDDDDDDEAENNGSQVAPMLIKYQCSTCKKCFNSHQALGGHRASHRKMKGCFARMKSLAAEETHESSEENNTEDGEFLNSEHVKGQNLKHRNLQPEGERDRACIDPSYKTSKKKFKGHECSICHRIFMTGQALGGHKRCHWTGDKAPADTASGASSNNYSTNNNKQSSLKEIKAEWVCRESSAGLKRRAKEDVIDLNLPAPLEEEDEVGFDVACRASMCTRLRPPMWNQQEWNPAKVAPIPQVCSMQTL